MRTLSEFHIGEIVGYSASYFQGHYGIVRIIDATNEAAISGPYIYVERLSDFDLNAPPNASWYRGSSLLKAKQAIEILGEEYFE